MSFFGTRPGYSTSAEAALLTALANLAVGGTGTAIQKTGTNSFANVSITSGGGGGGNIVSINGDTTSVQTIVTASTGTDFTITTTGGVTTVAIPTASASNRGLLSSTDWSTFNGKGTVTAVSVASTNGFAGTSSGGATPALTITTSINAAVLAGNGTAISAATTSGSGSTVVLATGPTMSNPTVGTQATTDNSTLAASTAYVTTAIANAIAAVNPAVAVQVATTQASDTSSLTYVHVAGIGDTFTGALNTAVTIDGHTLVLGDRVLIKNDTQTTGGVSAGVFNGVYVVTTIQTVGVGLVLTRAIDYDTPSDINNTGAIPVLLGTANAKSSWILTTTIAAVGTGTNVLTFAQFSYSPTTIISPTLGGTGIANNAASTITISGNFGMTFTITGTTSITFPTSGTLVNTAVTALSSLVSVGTITTGGLGIGATIAGVTMAIGSDAVGDIYAATTSNVLSRIAAVAVGQVLISKGTTTLPAYSASPTVSNLLTTSNAVTATSNAATVPVTSKITTVTNNSAATLTITITTTNAIDGQLLIVRVIDFSAVAQTITWVNTENSTVTAPTTSNGSTTLPLTVGFEYNAGTSKWRCIANA